MPVLGSNGHRKSIRDDDETTVAHAISPRRDRRAPHTNPMNAIELSTASFKRKARQSDDGGTVLGSAVRAGAVSRTVTRASFVR